MQQQWIRAPSVNRVEIFAFQLLCSYFVCGVWVLRGLRSVQKQWIQLHSIYCVRSFAPQLLRLYLVYGVSVLRGSGSVKQQWNRVHSIRNKVLHDAGHCG